MEISLIGPYQRKIQFKNSISDLYKIPCQWKYLRYDHTTVKFVYVIYLWKVLSL